MDYVSNFWWIISYWDQTENWTTLLHHISSRHSLRIAILWLYLLASFTSCMMWDINCAQHGIFSTYNYRFFWYSVFTNSLVFVVILLFLLSTTHMRLRSSVPCFFFQIFSLRNNLWYIRNKFYVALWKSERHFFSYRQIKVSTVLRLALFSVCAGCCAFVVFRWYRENC